MQKSNDLDTKRVDIAGSIFNTAPEVNNGATEFSDPKPHVTDVSDRTDEVIHTDGDKIEFTPNNAETETQ